ncbi:MAG: hypothetical protein ABJH28_18685 [Paraglaciecola sp.]|uniref:hypothetical protein n=1 Tax=Paraglaciecola sp. TaxID=1920173 RepID=UPI0032644A31
MNPYLAIMKRDYGASGAGTLWLPAPIFSMLFVALMTWWMASEGLDIKAWYFWGLTLLCTYRILCDLDLSHAHNLGVLAPNYKAYQFNYSTSLVFISSVMSCGVFADSWYEFFVFLSLFWLFISLIFFFVKKEIWKLAYFMIVGAYVLIVISLMIFEGIENMFTFLPKVYMSAWSILSIPIVGTFTSCVCLVVSYKSFLVARKHYLQPQEYNPDLVPITWKKYGETAHSSKLLLLLNAKWSSTSWGRLESRILFGLNLGRHQDLVYLGLFGAKTHGGLLKFIFGFLLLILLLPMLFMTNINQEAALIPLCIFMLFYLVVICSVISLEWITNRKMIFELWLFDASKSRTRYMLKLAVLFVERIARVSFLSCVVILLLATIISGMKGFMVVGLVAFVGVSLSLLLQMTYVLFVTLKVKNTGGLRYPTVLFTGINFVGWLSVVFFSFHQKFYWGLFLAIGLALVLCFLSIKYWCNYDKELVT